MWYVVIEYNDKLPLENTHYQGIRFKTQYDSKDEFEAAQRSKYEIVIYAGPDQQEATRLVRAGSRSAIVRCEMTNMAKMVEHCQSPEQIDMMAQATALRLLASC